MNTFCFTGNLGKDCEVRQAGNSTVCNFSVAVKAGYGSRESTVWVRCGLWGKKAEGKLPDYLRKGTQVAITGELSLHEYEANGEKRTSLEVNVSTLDLIGGKAEPAKAEPAPKPDEFDDFDSSIPF